MADYKKYLDRMDLPQDAVDALTQPYETCPEATRNAIDVLRRLEEAEALYRANGWSEEMFEGLLTDVRCKLKESKYVSGVWGAIPMDWHERFLTGKIVMLGRLQFEPGTWNLGDVPGYGKEGDFAVKCHIPSAGPLYPDAVQDSLRRAYEFFGQNPLLVTCKSWLLYPPHVALFPEGSNLKKFAALWRITEQHKRGTRDFRIVFGGADPDDLAHLPEKTSLQRAFAEWLREGNEMGTGFGFLVVRDGKYAYPA